MIKLHSNGIASDYTEHGSVTTDCKTVGAFMTEAVSIFGGEMTIKVDGCRFEIHDNPKMRVTDDTPIDEITYASTPGRMTFIVKTKPKPKTVRKSGWVNIYSSGSQRTTGIFVYDSEIVAKLAQSDQGYTKVATVKIEWEEVAND